jgi:SAM-dependent methyltransferase
MNDSIKDFHDSELYKADYFGGRNKNDSRRLYSYEQERLYLTKFMGNDGVVLDVGCSTGEFLSTIMWSGPRYGVEISEFAKSIAQTNGIVFDDSLFDQRSVVDVVVFRGTIQHLPNPFAYIRLAFDILKPGGYIVFLATPNANSVVYKVCNSLPALDSRLNYWIPSDITLSNNLVNVGFQVIDIDFPYIGSPYCNFVIDHLKFLLLLINKRQPSFAFWGNMMNVIARKPLE